MAYDLTNTLVIGISSTALFNMQESDNLLRNSVPAIQKKQLSNTETTCFCMRMMSCFLELDFPW